MDQYRAAYQRALACADRVRLLKKGCFLDAVPAGELLIDRIAFVPDIRCWFRLHGLRRTGDDAQLTSAFRLTVSEWVRSTVGSGSCAAFSLRKQQGSLSVLYGAGQESSVRAFSSALPECDLQRENQVALDCAFNGLLTGTIQAKRLADLFASSVTGDACVTCVVVPLSSEEIQQKLEKNRELIEYFHPYETFQRVYGNASRRVEETPIPAVRQAISLLKEENEYLERSMGVGFVRSAVRFGANTKSEAQSLASLIRSCIALESESQTAFEPPRAFFLRKTGNPELDCLAVPSVPMDGGNGPERVLPLTLQDIQSVASFCLPPLHSHEGYYVKDYNVGESAMEAFPLTSPVLADGIDLGTVNRSGIRAVLPFSSLHAHVFVTGATETGKTTTVKTILSSLHAAGIPFTVIEAAKKEYHALIGSIPELRVYTPGTDGWPLRFNPLQPEDGVLIENHVAAVVRALVAATGGEHPIPEAFDGLLKQTYLRFGWEYGMMAYTDGRRPFPTFQDVFEDVDAYIAQHAQYGPEVRQNLTAALKLRSETMHAGALGSLFRQPSGLRAADLLAAPSVIELADFSPQSAAFLMNMLLFQLHSYLSRQPESRELKRVIVVEEAHNIFRRTLTEDSGRALNNEYFDKLLAEIRSSGTGLILSDQRPGIMSDAVLANTSVKVIHALTEGEDKRIIGAAASLSEFQLKKLAEMLCGECVIALRGSHGVQHVQVQAAQTREAPGCACLVCATRFRCRREAVQKTLERIDPAQIGLHVSRLQANPYNPSALETNIARMLSDLRITSSGPTKLCLLGILLDKHGTCSMQEKRIIVNTYSNYLKRRDTNG